MSTEKRVFISTKFKNTENEEHLKTIETLVSELGFQVYTPVKELVDFGRKDTHLLKDHQKFMAVIKKEIEDADFILIDWQEKGVGIGVEAGAGWMLGKPIVVIHPTNVEVSMTIEGVASQIVAYSDYDELRQKLSALLKE